MEGRRGREEPFEWRLNTLKIELSNGAFSKIVSIILDVMLCFQTRGALKRIVLEFSSMIWLDSERTRVVKSTSFDWPSIIMVP